MLFTRSAVFAFLATKKRRGLGEHAARNAPKKWLKKTKRGMLWTKSMAFAFIATKKRRWKGENAARNAPQKELLGMPKGAPLRQPLMANFDNLQLAIYI